MHGNLKISIVTVSFNAAATIEATIKSVVDQTYDNIEYIIIDGGSTDGTVDIIRRYAPGGSQYGKHPNAVAHWVSEPDKGIYDAMNKGIAAATGDYIYFLGADDTLIHPDTIQQCSYIFQNGPNAIYYGNVQFKGTDVIYPKEIKSVYQLCLRNFSHQALFYPKEVYKNKNYDTSYKLWADYVYNLELYANRKFTYMNLLIAIFNLAGAGSVSVDRKFMETRTNLIKNLFGYKVATIMKLRYALSGLIHGFPNIRS